MDYPNTRRAVEQLPAWVNELAGTLPPPIKVQVPEVGWFRWEHQERTPEVAQVAKAVRMATALRAALVLADMHLTTEASSLLRMVGDFSTEIMFIGEALHEGRLTEEQKHFLDQHFETHPMTPEELEGQERVHYVGRQAVARAIGRLMEKWKGPREKHARVAAYLSKGYDRYVHGKYGTAMELFDPRTTSFMISGTDSARQVRAVKLAIAGKTVEGIISLRFMAITRGMERLEHDLNRAAEAISASP